ncbi:hypothetical protein MCEMRE254_00442 [Candidatus Nanopelagicaceae bacterium]
MTTSSKPLGFIYNDLVNDARIKKTPHVEKTIELFNQREGLIKRLSLTGRSRFRPLPLVD